MRHPSHVQLDVFEHPPQPQPIALTCLHESNLTADVLSGFLETLGSDSAIGVGSAYGPQGILRSVALATETRLLWITFGSNKYPRATRRSEGMDLLAREVFANPSYVKALFRADRFGTALHLDLGMRAVKTLDVLTLTVPTSSDPIAFFRRQEGTIGLRLSTLRRVFSDQRHGEQHINRIVSRAWVAYYVYVKFGAHAISQSAMLDTTHFTLAALDCLSNLVRDADSLDELKPVITKNDVAADFTFKDGQLQVQSSRYKTRVQASSAQTVRVEGKDNEKNTHVVCEGRAVEVQGRAATINLKTPLSGTEVSVWTVGKDPLTRAQAKRQRIIWGAFHMNNGFVSNRFVAAIWLSKALPVGLTPSALPPPPSIRFSKQINSSQDAAIKRILSDADEDAMAVIHGPPGTGKTTVIAAATNSISAEYPGRGVWLIAQSNVAVKNIAEKLASIGFYQFRLLVSEGFHFDWHEHLYSKIESNVIRSDDFPKDYITAERQLLDARVILCTISMMSAGAIREYAKIAPVETVIVDEASQIELGAYVPLLYSFSRTLAKLVFIGDDKQLPPHGQEDVPSLRSIFEVPHLRDNAIFLDTQYRMPSHIGNFISHYMYDSKLKTVHKDRSWGPCRFIDVVKGVEMQQGHSWVNQEEVAMILRVARRHITRGESFRIITGYDAQRNLIEGALKAANLPWEDKVFNVDAFQGNEEDYILVSVVRSSKPGFLSNDRRANVMLSRCKRGMYVFSSRAFLEGPGATSLVGRLAAECGDGIWLQTKRILNGSW